MGDESRHTGGADAGRGAVGGGGRNGAVGAHGVAGAGRGGAVADDATGGVAVACAGRGRAGTDLSDLQSAAAADEVACAGCGRAGADGDSGPGGEWASLRQWLLASPMSLRDVDLLVLRERLGCMGRARAAIAAYEAEVIAEISRREGEKAAEEMLCRDQKRSRAGARKAVKVAGQLEWSPEVADKLAEGAITPEAAGMILDAAADAPVDRQALLDAAEAEPEDQLRRTIKQMVNDATSEQELQERRASQRRRRRASITEQADGMFHLFAQFDPLTGNRVRAALLAKSDELFRAEDAKDRPTPQQRSADALAELICNNSDSDGKGAPVGAELIVLADYDLVRERVVNARLADDTPLTEAEALALACDARILPGIFNKHTGEPLLGRSKRKVSPRLRKRLVARDRGCIGCRVTEKICEVHHIYHWRHGGETTLENTCLLCHRCHHIRVHLNGEEVIRRPDGSLTLQPPNTTRPTPREPEPGHPPPTRPPPNPPPAQRPPSRPAPTGAAAGDDSHQQPRLLKPQPPRRSALHDGAITTIACKRKPPPAPDDLRTDAPRADEPRTADPPSDGPGPMSRRPRPAVLSGHDRSGSLRPGPRRARGRWRV